MYMLIKVAISVERFLSVTVSNWNQVLFNARRAAILSLSIITTFLTLNIHLAFTLEFNTNENNTDLYCFTSNMYILWRTVMY